MSGRRLNDELLALMAEHDLLRFEVDLEWIRLAAKAGFNFAQPRIPGGQTGAGQWTDGGAGSGVVAGRQEDPRSDVDRGVNVVRVARRISIGKEAECAAQLKRDMFHCDMVGNVSCRGQAMERYAACLRGRPLPPLSY